MAADVINQVLVEEAGRIGPEILTETIQKSIWIDYVPTGAWPEGMGESIKIQTFGRALPTASAGGSISAGTWTDINSGTYGDAGGGCLPTVTNVRSGTIEAEYNLQHSALESESFCVNNLRNAFQREKQMAALKENLAASTEFMMVERARDEFSRVCTNHVLVTTAGVEIGTTMPTGAAKTAAAFTTDFLTDWYEKLGFYGASRSKLLAREDGAPIYPLITSQTVSRALKVASGTRDDYRYNPNFSEELLKMFSGLGAVSKPVLGFQHIIEQLPPRWNYSSGWVRVWPFTQVAGDTGYVLQENADYHTATWEDSFIYNPDVIKLLYPSSITNAGGGASFQPVQYRGEWKFQNILHATDNPDGTMGKFRAIFATGTEPRFGKYGVRIRHKRVRNADDFIQA